MCSSTTAERQSLAWRDRTCCLRRCLPARPLRFYGFRGSIAHPSQSLCTLRTRRRRRLRNTRYRAPATAYPNRSLTGRNTPAYLAHKQSILVCVRQDGLLRFARNDGETYASPSRGAKRPSCARTSRPKRGRGECRVPVAPAAACAVVEGTRVSHHGRTGTPGIPARNGFNSLFRALPGDRAFLSPSPRG